MYPLGAAAICPPIGTAHGRWSVSQAYRRNAIAGVVGVISLSASWALAEDVAGDTSINEVRRYVTDQPQIFDNEVFFARDGDDFVRSDHFVGVSDVFGDYDGDSDVDIHDYNAFRICFAVSGPSLDIPSACDVFDSQGDHDVDLADFSTFMEMFTASLTVVEVKAGGLVPSRSSVGLYYSGEPGTSGNNALNGTAAQAAYTQDDLWYEWSVVSQPTGSGEVIMSNSSLPATAFTVLPPATAGTYVFRLDVTNLITLESGFDAVVLELLDVPMFAVKPDSITTRWPVLRGTSGAEIPCTYSIDSDGFASIYDGDTPLDSEPNPADLIVTQALTVGVNREVTISLSATGKREAQQPRTFFLTQLLTDEAGTEPGDGTENVQGVFQDAAASVPILGRAVMYTSDGWTATRPTRGVPVISLDSSVGIPDGGGTIIHYGVGKLTGLSERPILHHVPGSIKTADMNGDGRDDLLSMSDTADLVLECRFGLASTVTQDGGAAAGGRDGAWPTTPDFTIKPDWSASDYAVGDFNDDGNMDVFFVNEQQPLRAVQVFLLDGANTLPENRFPDRTYRGSFPTEDFGGAQAEAGDVNGDGVDDMIWAFPKLDDDVTLTEGEEAHNASDSEDGLLFVHYGVPSALPTIDLAPDGALMISQAVSGNVGGVQRGELISDIGTFNQGQGDQFGTLLTVGQYDGGAMDIIIGEGAGTGEVRVYLGASPRLNKVPSRVWTAETGTDLASGLALLGDLTGADGTTDVVVLARGNDTVYVVPNGLSNGSLHRPQVPRFDTTLVPVDWSASPIATDDDAALYDVDFDGNLDLVLGRTVTGRVFVIPGPINANIESELQILRV